MEFLIAWLAVGFISGCIMDYILYKVGDELTLTTAAVILICLSIMGIFSVIFSVPFLIGYLVNFTGDEK